MQCLFTFDPMISESGWLDWFLLHVHVLGKRHIRSSHTTHPKNIMFKLSKYLLVAWFKQSGS